MLSNKPSSFVKQIKVDHTFTKLHLFWLQIKDGLLYLLTILIIDILLLLKQILLLAIFNQKAISYILAGLCKVKPCPHSKIQGQLPQKDHATVFVVDPVKIFLTHSLITMQKCCCFSYCVCACRSQKFWKHWGPAPFEPERGWPPRNTLLHHLLPQKTLKRFRVRRSQKFWGHGDIGPAHLEWERGWPLEICFSPHYSAKFGHSRSDGSSIIIEICQKILTHQA